MVTGAIIWSNYEAKGRYGPKQNQTIVIPFTGKGEDAKLGQPRMLSRAEQAKMQAGAK